MTARTTTVAGAIRDLQRDDVMAVREDIATGAPAATATVWTTDDEELTILDAAGEPMTVAAALAEIDAEIASLFPNS